MKTTLIHRIIGATYLMIIFAICQFAATTLAGSLSDARGIFKRSISNVVPLESRDLRILLAELNQISIQQTPPRAPSIAEFDATVLCDDSQSIAERSKIRIQARLSAGGTGRPLASVGWTPGTIFLMLVATTPQQGQFEYVGWAKLMGIEMPCPVMQADVPLIKTALQKLGEIARTEDGMLARNETLKLLNAGANYYLWALGASAVAAQNDKTAMDELYERMLSKTLSPRQVVWLDHCFGYFEESDELRVSIADRHQLLLQYLQRLDPVSPPTTAPSRFGAR